MAHRAVIALGSNMGDRVAMIEQACKEMESTGRIKIKRTSSLWETKAMYVLDQDMFVNGACEIETSLSPIELLDELQAIENRMGRVKVIDKGPRNIDLDISLYGNLTFSNERLQIPHLLMLEREFVLRPLCEIIPEEVQGNLPIKGTLQQHLARLPPSDVPLSPMTPLAPGSLHISAFHSQRDTRIMSILNVTPDSFSDGGKNYNIEEATLAATIKSHVAAGATVIDVGGQSTRPGSVQVSFKEELSRILPAVTLIRSLPEAKNMAISVDTYRANVAEAAIKAGADIINDVSAGLLDEAMLPTVARLGCTICLMHMRGTPETMSNLASYPDGVVETVGRELLERVRAAEEAGIRRWRIILDPGIGFAKTQEHNLELLRRQGELRNYPGLEGLPWLVGTSRKAFVGKITCVKEAKDRVWGTTAAVTAAIQGGADIVRVHDVQEMVQVAKMADAIWRV
ncbi:folic acid synthesis protein-like protein [Cucurbitaria berberidis CBS 394.84]|uniref:Folic acid synthesis protein FOL1 n=1 Tax=Cucurbitaria berberidis CBS 394.84 TaxID=1168544 RepID=A0A9P4GDN4_9PLEO|nr:folic acid synthesis protein-like protein [Cucurbitaria berberidis CBS 394.84]KAF1843339.1 folic acid synthesis protein-like protein [Cucurbitaria berberidis CBS 394.84]